MRRIRKTTRFRGSFCTCEPADTQPANTLARFDKSGCGQPRAGTDFKIGRCRRRDLKLETNMSRGMPSMTALLGLLAIAGYQNRDKLAEMLKGASANNPTPGGGARAGRAARQPRRNAGRRGRWRAAERRHRRTARKNSSRTARVRPRSPGSTTVPARMSRRRN